MQTLFLWDFISLPYPNIDIFFNFCHHEAQRAVVIPHIIITEHHEIASLPSGVRNDVCSNLNS
ncbi:MAG: hypothetical protein GQ544_10095 [Candidatus Aminicenantes bacterium]|nr:hypothetical protein [Candidatus Aminicenantes bacterium]